MADDPPRPAPTEAEDLGRAEAEGRRLLGVEGAALVTAGILCAAAGGPIGRAAGMSGASVRAAGVLVGASGIAIATASVAEDWEAVLRPVTLLNAAICAGAAGLTLGRRGAGGWPWGVLAGVAGLAVQRQAGVLVRARGPVVA